MFLRQCVWLLLILSRCDNDDYAVSYSSMTELCFDFYEINTEKIGKSCNTVNFFIPPCNRQWHWQQVNVSTVLTMVVVLRSANIHSPEAKYRSVTTSICLADMESLMKVSVLWSCRVIISNRCTLNSCELIWRNLWNPHMSCRNSSTKCIIPRSVLPSLKSPLMLKTSSTTSFNYSSGS